ncbi:MAG: DUF456 domain-containing protein [Pirellulales bacterium]
MVYLGLLVFLLALIVGWLMNLFSLPGNWLIVAATALFAYAAPDGGQFDITWTAVLVILGLAIAGEIVEFAAGAVGAARVGGSRRGALMAIVGSMIGGLTGAVLGLPVPLIGPLLGAVLFAGVGALVGAMLGEAWKGRQLQESWQVGQAAFWGRLLGTLAKTLIASAMVVIAAVAALVDGF